MIPKFRSPSAGRMSSGLVSQATLAYVQNRFSLMSPIKSVSKYVLSMFMIGAGTMHFVNPDFYVRMMPPAIPLHDPLVVVSGVCEIMLGLLLLVPRCSRWAAWGIIALLIAVFPANIYVYQNQELIPAPPLVHLLRLPLQGVLILWAYWHTRLDDPTSKKPSI